MPLQDPEEVRDIAREVDDDFALRDEAPAQEDPASADKGFGTGFVLDRRNQPDQALRQVPLAPIQGATGSKPALSRSPNKFDSILIAFQKLIYLRVHRIGPCGPVAGAMECLSDIGRR